jgi:hypothetical protein
MAVQINIATLTHQVNELGWKKDQIAAHYDLSMAQTTKLLQQAKLQIRKFHKPAFELIMEPVAKNQLAIPFVAENQVSKEEVATPVSEAQTISISEVSDSTKLPEEDKIPALDFEAAEMVESIEELPIIPSFMDDSLDEAPEFDFESKESLSEADAFDVNLEL